MFTSWNCQSLQLYYHLLNIFVVIACSTVVQCNSLKLSNNIYLKFVELNLVNKQIMFGVLLFIGMSGAPEFQVCGSLKP